MRKQFILLGASGFDRADSPAIAFAIAPKPRVIRQDASDQEAVCPPADHSLQFVISGIVACPGVLLAPPNGTFTLAPEPGGSVWNYIDANYFLSFICDGSEGLEQLTIEDATSFDDWFIQFFATPGQTTLNNDLTSGSCSPGNVIGYDGTATWTIL